MTLGGAGALLGGAAGFALAASGLFLPTDDEAAARKGALGGELGGRRGKDHKGRHRRGAHGDRKDEAKRRDGRDRRKDDRPPARERPAGA